MKSQLISQAKLEGQHKPRQMHCSPEANDVAVTRAMVEVVAGGQGSTQDCLEDMAAAD